MYKNLDLGGKAAWKNILAEAKFKKQIIKVCLQNSV